MVSLTESRRAEAEPLLRSPAPLGRALVLLAVWTGLGLLFASHFRAYYRIDWPLALWWGLKDWYLWGMLAPLVVHLTRRVPPTPERWPRAVVVHALAACSLAVVHSALAVSLSAPFEGLDVPLFAAVRGHVLKRYTLSFVTYGAIAGIAHALDLHRRPREPAEPTTTPAPPTTPEGVDARATGFAERLLVRKAGRERFLDVGRIERVEAEGNYVRIHAAGASYLERRTLRALEAQLDPARFLRVHRSHIVNVDRIDRIEPRFKGGHAVVLRDGTALSLSRSYRKRIEERVGRSL